MTKKELLDGLMGALNIGLYVLYNSETRYSTTITKMTPPPGTGLKVSWSLIYTDMAKKEVGYSTDIERVDICTDGSIVFVSQSGQTYRYVLRQVFDKRTDTRSKVIEVIKNHEQYS